MTLAAFETSLIEYVGDRLVNECGRPVPDKILRYHGVFPADCCTANGALWITWDKAYPSTEFPLPNSSRAQAPLPASVLTFPLTLGYRVCWKGIKTAAGVLIPMEPEWDADAAVLADVGECISRALMHLVCGKIDGEFAQAVLDQVPCNKLRFIDATPVTPSGLCAGIAWHLFVGL